MVWFPQLLAWSVVVNTLQVFTLSLSLSSHQLQLVPLCVLPLHLLMQLSYELPEDEGVNVLAQLVQEEPVSKTKLPADSLHLSWLLGQPRPRLQEHRPHARHEAGGEAVDNLSEENDIIVIDVFYPMLM